MKHLFVPYELALELKDKKIECGFIGGYFQQDGKTPFLCYGNEFDEAMNAGNDITFEVSAPMYQQVIDLLREKHNINIEIVYNDFGGNNTKKENRTWYHYISDMNGEHNNGTHGKEMLPYYDALNKAIEEALILIK